MLSFLSQIMLDSILNSPNTIRVFVLSDLGSLAAEAVDFLGGVNLPNLKHFGVYDRDTDLAEIAPTIRSFHGLESMKLELDWAPGDDKTLRSLLRELALLKGLKYGYYPSPLPVDYDQAHDQEDNLIDLGDRIMHCDLTSFCPINFACPTSVSLRTLMLEGRLHDNFTIQFPNLTSLSFEGPIRGLELTQAVDWLMSLTHLHSISIRSVTGLTSDRELEIQLARLLSSNHVIISYDVELSFSACPETHSVLVDIHEHYSLAYLNWRLRNFPVVVTLPPGASKIHRDSYSIQFDSCSKQVRSNLFSISDGRRSPQSSRAILAPHILRPDQLHVSLRTCESHS